MDTPTLVDRVAAQLEQLGFEVNRRAPPPGTPPHGADALIHVGKGKKRLVYLVETKRGVTPATLGATLAQLRDLGAAGRRPALLVADYLTPPVAEALKAQDQPFADAAGNAYLRGPGMFVYVTGRKPPREETPPAADRTHTIASLKIVFALMCDPPLAEAPHRAIAATADVALGAVPGVLADLRRNQHLVVMAKRRRLHATRRLLDEWALDYARRLRPKTLIATFTTPNFDQWREWRLADHEARWGGEPAAALLVGHLRPGALTIYAKAKPAKLMIEQRLTNAQPYETERTVEIRRPFWGADVKNTAHPDTVPPALVYADLLAVRDGRCLETAQLVYEQHLARFLPAK